MVSIGLVCVTAPIIGVIIGGYVADRSGGASNVEFCILLGFKSCFIGYCFINLMTYLSSPLGCVVFLWIGVICCIFIILRLISFTSIDNDYDWFFRKVNFIYKGVLTIRSMLFNFIEQFFRIFCFTNDFINFYAFL